MEILTWQGDEITKSFYGCVSLSDIISRIENEKWQGGQVVSSVRVNNMALNEIEEQKFSQSGLDEIHSVEVVLVQLRELIHESELSLKKLVHQLAHQSFDVGDKLRGHSAANPAPSFIELLDGIRVALDTANLINSARQSESLQPRALLTEFESHLYRMMSQILSAYEKADFTLAADLIEYDLSNMFTDLVQDFEKSNVEGQIDGK